MDAGLEMEWWYAWCDASHCPQSRRAGIGVVLEREREGLLRILRSRWKHSTYRVVSTAMEAEFEAMEVAVQQLLKNGATGQIRIHTDNYNIARLLDGRSKAKAQVIKKRLAQLRKLIVGLEERGVVEIVWVPRTENKTADRLSRRKKTY